MIRLSVVDSVTDREPKTFGTIEWDEFTELMREHSQVTAEPSKLGKASTPCVSPAIYPTNANRLKANVEGWDWFSADIDNKTGNRPGATIDDISAIMVGFGAPHIIYTTASHQPDAQCFRLMFPLDRMVTASEFDSVWRSFALTFGCFDEQTKDISRLFIVPRAWTSRDNRFVGFTNGNPVCVNDIIVAQPVAIAAPIDSSLFLAIARSTALNGRTAPNLTDLDTSPIVSRRAVDIALGGSVGGRMFRFLCSVACSARRQGYNLDVYDLRSIGEQMGMRMGRRGLDDLNHDVRNALRFADNQVVADRAWQLERFHSVLNGRRHR